MSGRRRPFAPGLLLLAACAQMGPPPGAPPDHRAPVLLSTIPESLAVMPGYDGWVEFQFDEVVSEGGQPNFGFGSGGLEQLVTISPDSGVPRVRWRRSRIQIQPRDGWRPDRVYRVELGAGLRDLAAQPNIRDSAAVITFTTGAPAPTRWLEGRTVDWMQQRFAPRTLIEAILLPDTLVYRTTADTAGHFRFGPLPDGEYLVRAVQDQNTNRRRDGREPWDTIRAEAGRTALGEIWMFPRDTLPPRIDQNGIARADSFAIALTLTQPVDPALRLDGTAVRIRTLPDSVEVPVASAYPQVIHDSIYTPIDSMRRAIAAAAALVRDSIAADSAEAARRAALSPDSLAVEDSLAAVAAAARAARDSTPPVVRPTPPATPRPATADTTLDLPTQTRPRIGTRLMIRLNAALLPGTRYLIEVRGVRALSGTVADTLRGQLAIPEERKP